MKIVISDTTYLILSKAELNNLPVPRQRHVDQLVKLPKRYF